MSLLTCWTNEADKGIQALTFELGGDGELVRGGVPVDGQYIGLAADLTILDVLLFGASGFVYGGFDPFATACALESGWVHRFPLLCSAQAGEVHDAFRTSTSVE
jgi:hypothetical protein